LVSAGALRFVPVLCVGIDLKKSWMRPWVAAFAFLCNFSEAFRTRSSLQNEHEYQKILFTTLCLHRKSITYLNPFSLTRNSTKLSILGSSHLSW
jgi:hypothetical protein